MSHLSLALALGAFAASGGAGCGSSSDQGFGDAAAEAGARLDGAKHETGPGKLGGNDAATASLVITPKDPQLTVPKPGTTLLFHLSPGGTTSWVSASWSLDAPEIGSFDSAGLFTASGLVGGTTTVTARAAGGSATTTLTVKLELTATSGNVSSAVQKQLEAGGAAPPAVATGPTPDAAAPPDGGEIDAASSDQALAAAGFEWLYPYDGTVFPRGLSEPILQFSGAAADALYVHITIPSVEYEGFFGSGSMGQVDIGASAWQAITSSATASDSVLVQITKVAGGVVTGPITEHWSIAQGTLKGTVYYNSYDSQLFGTAGASNGGILKLKPGSLAAPLVGGATRSECTVCHAVSSDGSTLIATHPASDDPSSGYTAGTTYDLKNNAAVVWQQPDSELAFGGIYPDGTFLMTNGAVGTAENIPGQYGYGANSRLITTNGGTVIPAAGWDGVISIALSPSFSADGTKIGFTHYDLDQSNHTIAVMDFSVGTHAFSNLVDIATDPNHFLGWPTFTPDNEWVIFHADTRPDLATWVGDDANLVIAHVASKTTANLDVLNGFKNGHAYVPYGVDDLNHNYEPTMLPVAVGGYYWVVFTSRRNYGNTIEGMDAWDLPSGAPSPRKKLWVAALDIDPSGHPSTSAHDISHPAFYLDGQELTSGNSRGFWALDPCAANGGGCQSGDECCSGFCRAGGVVADGGTHAPDGGAGANDGGSGLTCVAAATGCSEEYEKCTTSSDCCGAAQGYACINAHCAAPAPK
jgi:hypothetical protein